MTDEDMTAHAKTLWLDIADFLLKNATDMGGDTSLPELQDIADENAPKLLTIIKARLQQVADRAAIECWGRPQ